MNESKIPISWSQRFGLALSPMFERYDDALPGEHHVLLDGGYGSFALSVIDENVDPNAVAGWAWSSDLPHHVAINSLSVQVVRWDSPSAAQTYSLQSIDRDLDAFYHFLCKDRPGSNRTVVQHLVNLFGRIRSLVAHAGLADSRTIDGYVTVLGDLISNGAAKENPNSFGLPTDAADLRNHLNGPTLDEALREIRTAPASLSALSLHPNLAIRHAGGQLFQEAHFDLVRASPPDMFGYVETAHSARNSRGGTHFTPPALARCIVDHALKQLDDLPSRQTLVVCDPACGSGAFLHEALRGLRRTGFDGSLNIIGIDISPAAITMARFTLTVALRDWEPAGGATLQLDVGDSLNNPCFPRADLIVMNPPFISIIAQTTEQKAQLREAVGSEAASRGDYSMAFVTRALDSLTDGGAMGTLFPANLLTHKASISWRDRLATEGDVRMLASIGDFGMFSQALVHVALAIIRKSSQHQPEFTALVTENEPAATGDALRQLRKTDGTPPAIATIDSQWKLFATDSSLLRHQPWRLLTPQQRRILDALEAAQTPTVGDLFDISQGVQTGNRKVFLLKESDFTYLPPKEKHFFRKAVMTDSINNGEITRIYYLFFPHDKDGPLFPDEASLSRAVPHFYRTVLKPNEEALRNRASIIRSGRPDWWGLMRPRKFSFDTSPRIISKFFGSAGSFVLDVNAEYLPSTAHVWIPKLSIVRPETIDEIGEEVELDILRAYTALLNSEIFAQLVSYRSVVVAGGQFDLSSRFITGTFLPNFWEKMIDSSNGIYVAQLARIQSEVRHASHASQRDVDQLVALLYGVPQLVQG